MIPLLDHLSELVLCAHKLRTIIAHNQCRCLSDGEESSQCLHEFQG